MTGTGTATPAATVGAREHRHVLPGRTQTLVVGAGLAGLTTALDLAERGVPVTLATAGRLGADCASDWAQGGLAAALGAGDAPAAHAADTLASGAGLAAPDVVARVTAAAPKVVERLLRLGAEVERDIDGSIALGLEGGHSTRRIVHAGGDASGHLFTASVARAVRANSLVTVAEYTWVSRLLVDDGRIVGALARVRTRRGVAQVVLPTEHVVLATGGVGSLFAATTNPGGSGGSGLALGLRAGAVARDLELVQFHPTALDVGLDPMPLVSEAVRGEGARLVLADGTRILDDDLATRDKVARAVFAHVDAGRKVYLDTAAALGSAFATAFPSIDAACLAAGIDPAHNLVPVRPAAHYHMGGLLVDSSGRTTVPGLWAGGEVASTGLHGANRLASNSLLEAMAYGPWIADDIAAQTDPRANGGAGAEVLRARATAVAARPCRPVEVAGGSGSSVRGPARCRLVTTRQVLSSHAGVIRDAHGLRAALDILAPGCTTHDDRLVATLIVAGALERQESRGGHFRTDFPGLGEATHTTTTIEDADVLATTRILERSAS